MSDEQLQRSSERPSGLGGHPKGTLAVVVAYGLLFALGWLILYFFVFVPRGTLTQ